MPLDIPTNLLVKNAYMNVTKDFLPLGSETYCYPQQWKASLISSLAEISEEVLHYASISHSDPSMGAKAAFFLMRGCVVLLVDDDQSANRPFTSWEEALSSSEVSEGDDSMTGVLVFLFCKASYKFINVKP
jgi:hypothetical protein